MHYGRSWEEQGKTMIQECLIFVIFWLDEINANNFMFLPLSWKKWS